MGSATTTRVAVIPVLGFATLSKFDLAERLLASIDYEVQHLVIVNNSGKQTWKPKKPDLVQKMWHIEVPYGLGANGAWNLIIKSTPHAPYWVIPNDDSWFAPGALKTIHDKVNPEAFNFVDVEPRWSCVVPGAGAVLRAGIYDEAFHPIYFDDNDLERRLRAIGVPFNDIPAKVHHENSSTLKSGYSEKNSKTFQKNQALHNEKTANNEMGVRGWSLQIRRENSWD